MILHRTKIDLDFDYFLKAHSNNNLKGCISNLRRNQIHSYEYPKSYNEENTMMSRFFHDTKLISLEVLQVLGIEKIITISTICQPPGNIIPPHLDTFYKEKQEHPNNVIIRANVFLEDFKIGHMLQTGQDEILDSGFFKAGDTWIWDSNVFHCSANAGFDPKYTMQITGVLAEDAKFLN